MKRNLTTVKKLAQNKTWKTAKPLLGKLVKWTAWAVLALILTVAVLYTVGSYRKASDDSQLALVRISLVLSLLLIISSIYGIILDLFYAVRRRRLRYLTGVLGYILVAAFGALIALGSAFIIGAVGGNLK